MMIVATGLTIGLVISAVLTVLILASLAYNPRLWIQDAPPAMQEAVTPLTRREKRDRVLWAIPIFAVALLIPLGALFWIEASTFLERFLFLWVAMMTFNVIDLVIIDWLIVVWWQPSWTTLPEVAHLNHLNDYAFHFKGFLKGAVGITLFTLAVAGGVTLLWG